MKNLFITVLTLWGLTSYTYAQQDNQPCGTEIPSIQWENEFQKIITDYKTNQQSNKGAGSVYTIPIIFHVIHSGQSVGTFPNLNQGQINSQITVLNQDFSGAGLNVGNYPANAFTNWVINQALPLANVDSNGRVKIANTEIQFCLATKDTLGNILSEPGIDRIDINSKGWTNPNTFTTTNTLRTYMNGTIKPQSIWDVTKYLNIWVSDRNSAIMFTGFASMPPFSTLTGIIDVGTDTTDGVWCYAKALGSNTIYPSGIYAAPQVEGRTITHEVGHWLGLRHIWGDGSCVTDYCDDTPSAATQNIGSPTYPQNVGSCSSPANSPDGEMFMNFMDYPSDPNKYMFTVDQATRMQTAMLNSPFRNQLGTHGLCSTTTSISEIDNSTFPIIYPNPTNGNVTINLPNQKIQCVKIYNHTGELLQEYFTRTFSITNLPSGLYFITAQTDKGTYVNKLIKQ